MSCDLMPTVAIKALVYPGAIAKALVKNEAIPSYSNLNLHDPSAVTAADAIADLQRLEVSTLITFLLFGCNVAENCIVSFHIEHSKP